MIPKIIHYCWLSDDPVPEALQKYMKSWEEKLPDYEFMLWNFDCFDKASSLWVSQAFDNKKYAFAVDYIRLFAVYNHGGIYMDMDIEVLKNLYGDYMALPPEEKRQGHGILDYDFGRYDEIAREHGEGAAIIFIVLICLTDKIQIGDVVKIMVLSAASLLAACSFIFYVVVTLKDDRGIRFAKLNGSVSYFRKF